MAASNATGNDNTTPGENNFHSVSNSDGRLAAFLLVEFRSYQRRDDAKNENKVKVYGGRHPLCRRSIYNMLACRTLCVLGNSHQAAADVGGWFVGGVLVGRTMRVLFWYECRRSHSISFRTEEHTECIQRYIYVDIYLYFTQFSRS